MIGIRCGYDGEVQIVNFYFTGKFYFYFQFDFQFNFNYHVNVNNDPCVLDYVDSASN